MIDQQTIQQIRQYLDGELSPAEAARVRDLLENNAQLQKHAQSETRLKQEIARVMTDNSIATPVGLEAAIRESFQTDSANVAGVIETMPEAILEIRPARANIYAIAATLLIVAGAILFGIFGRPIDDMPGAPIVDVIADSAVFMSGEHTRCASSDESLEKKLIYRDATLATESLAAHLGVESLPSFDLSSLGYEFIGGGPCRVPTASVSGHLMFRGSQPKDGMIPMVSIFLVPNEGQFDQLIPGTYEGEWFDCSVGTSCSRTVLSTVSGGVAYFICCCNDGDLGKIADLVSQQLAAP